MLSKAIKNAGYNVKSSFTGIDGLNEIKTNSYDLVLLDIMLPYKSGDQILKEVRQFSSIPIIIISAKDMISTKIDLLKLGADDYITKPFDLGEVIARIESNLRRYSISAFQTSLFTSKEYMILELLLKNQNKVFSKANLYESIWHEEYIGDDNVIKTHISNIRSKLKKFNKNENYIETVWGLGYRLFKK